jgi:hypothetical protein
MQAVLRRTSIPGVLITALTVLAMGCGEQVGQPTGPSDRALEPTILYGDDDGSDHPWVGVTVFHDGTGWFFCSGSLIDDDSDSTDRDTFLTAGHCTADAIDIDGSGDGVPDSWVTFAVPWGIWAGFPGPPAGAPWIHGTPTAHPSYNNFIGFPQTSDVGVIELDYAQSGLGYGELAAVGTLDGIDQQRGRKNQQFDVVGFGVSGAHPLFNGLDGFRYQGHPNLIALNSALTGGWNIQLTGSPGVKHPGALCDGDSGGPALYLPGSNDIVGVGSFGITPWCMGNGFYYRVDTNHAQDWIDDFL